MTLPAANATLTAVATDTGGVDLETLTTTATAVWSGTERVLYRETVDRTLSANANDLTARRTLVVPATLGETIDAGHTVTWTPDGGTARTDRVQMVERRDTPGLPAHVRTARVLLETT